MSLPHKRNFVRAPDRGLEERHPQMEDLKQTNKQTVSFNIFISTILGIVSLARFVI